LTVAGGGRTIRATLREAGMACSRPLAWALVAALAVPVAAVAQVPAGPEFRVNAYTTGMQASSSVAFGRDGRLVFGWETRPVFPGPFDVRAQRFDALGQPLGAEFTVNTYTTYNQRDPEVGLDAAGNFVVVWSGDPSRPGVFAQRYDAQGAPRGGEFQVNTVPHPGFTSASAATNPDGSFVVVWTSTLGISARRFDAAGAGLGAEFQVNSQTPLTISIPVVAADAAGNFVVVWEVEPIPFDKNLAGRLFTAAGAPIGGDFAVNAYTTGRQARAAVARDPQGGFVVAWNGLDGYLSGYGVVAQRFDAAGGRLGTEFVVNTYTPDDQSGPSVAMDDSGSFVIAWRSAYQDGSGSAVVGQRFDAQGARRGAEFIVNTYTTGYQSFPDVASDRHGNFVVTWTSDYQDGDDLGVFAQRFGGLFPAALAVDTPGNGVLEPGETSVRVSPSWANQSGASRTFGGQLGAFGGPAPAVYTIVDPQASYGTVAAGATAACGADCYMVGVTTPGTRPTHWDATATETITPAVLGQVKTWTLHVGRSFTDVPTTSPFYRFIETALHHNVTSGCSPTTFCPAAAITRAQIAVFGLRALDPTLSPPACVAGSEMFADVPSTSPFCRWIEELARRGVVGGCGGGNYCPEAPLTREQMPVILLRLIQPTLNPPPCVPPNMFLDVPETSPFCRWIEHMAQGGGIAGCGGGNYCPLATMTREQMSVFMSAAFGLTLYGP
jgi:hypothetical protein